MSWWQKSTSELTLWSGRSYKRGGKRIKELRIKSAEKADKKEAEAEKE